MVKYFLKCPIHYYAIALSSKDIKGFLLNLALQENWNSSDHSEHSVMWVMWCGVVQHNLLPHYFFMVRRDKKPRIFHGDISVFLQTFLFVWVISHISCSERPLVQCCCKERRMRGHLCCVQLTAGWCIIREEDCNGSLIWAEIMILSSKIRASYGSWGGRSSVFLP